MRKRLVPVLTAALMAAPLALAAPAHAATGFTFRTLGEIEVPSAGTFGGLSGVDYDPGTGTWRAISEDRSVHAPARFYSLSLGVSTTALTASAAPQTVTLLRADGTPYPAGTVQPAAIRYDATTKNVFWANAGENTATATADPAVRESTPTGQYVAQLPVSKRLAPSATAGIQDGQGLSGLTFSTNNALAVSTVAGPLLQDGTGFTRITGQTRPLGWNIVWQYAYALDSLPDNRVEDILAVDTTHYLVLESTGSNSRLYEIDVTGATNVAGLQSLAGAKFTPVSKTLVLDFSTLGLRCGVPDFSGLTWGPTLPDGEKTLVLVSDNKFAQNVPTDVLALAVQNS